MRRPGRWSAPARWRRAGARRAATTEASAGTASQRLRVSSRSPRQLHDRVRLARGRQLDAVGAARRAGRRLQHAASAIREVQRQHFLERRVDQPVAHEGLRAEDEQAAATLSDEVAGRLELIGAERSAFDVGEHHRVVAEQVLALRGIAGGQRGASRERAAWM